MRPLLPLALLALSACTTTPPETHTPVLPPHDTVAPPDTTPPPPVATPPDTVSELRDQPDSIFYYRTPTGKLLRVLQWPGEEEDEAEATSDTAGHAATIRSLTICGADGFTGVKRGAAKTSNVGGTKTTYQTVTALRATLAGDATMRAKLTSTSPRVAEEKHKVKLVDVYLLAVAHESDNDYHIIVGDAVNYTTANIMNVEVSGIPAAGNSTLQHVRDAFENYFVTVCGSSYKVFLTEPERVTIEGSLFFDVDHASGTSGTGTLKPSTAWEIHPVSKLTVL